MCKKYARQKDANGNTISDPYNIGNLNPFRYRGYYYDTESGLYYLQSRYYDPITNRFVNADGLIQTGQGLGDKNMFAYCGNNPIMNADPTGEYSVSFRAAEYREYLNEGYSSGAASAEVNEHYPADPLPSKPSHAASKVSKKKGVKRRKYRKEIIYKNQATKGHKRF
ncbi:MAG: RHS repeat-associated core domain-containing protein [Bacillota bacterium]|nr:RHS repeat-associated core domain-containing protein [Bacillota bacterium]